MAQPLQLNDQISHKPRTVLGVQPVMTALVSYVDEAGQVVTQLAVIGTNNVNLLESRALGIAKATTPQGRASKWLTDGILAAAKQGK